MGKDSKATKRGTLLTFTPTGDYYFTKGLKSYQHRDLHKAKKYLERAMELEPGEPMIACQLAIIYAETGEYKVANQLLHTILEEWDEDMTECHYFLANNYAHLGLFKDAYHHATLYLKLEEDGEFVEDAEDLLDLLLLEAEDMEEEDFYNQDDLISKQEEAREFLEIGNFVKAVELLENVIQEFPEYWSAYNNLALAYYYLGQIEEAEDTLNEVLERNPGNLHALCNKVVFASYQDEQETVKKLKEVLLKIKPLSSEHQFKLGTTFAIIGEYEAAYSWLKRLYRQGFDGEGPFYYWLSYSAYHTGRQQTAEKSWQKVLQLSPEKEGQEPWNEQKPAEKNNEEQVISNYLKSDCIEQRLFGRFLMSLTKNKEFEECFLPNKDVANNTALELYRYHQPLVEAELYLLWFTAYANMEIEGQEPKNEKACAAAIDYLWRKQRNEKCSQQSIADLYHISLSSVQKYVKIVNKYIH